MDQQTVVTATQATGMGIGVAILWLAVYIFTAYCIARIAVKLGRPFGTSFIMALIPIANIILLIQMAGRPIWWLILVLLVPIANFICLIIIWVDIIKKLGRPGWWFILMLIPVVNLIFFLILTFEKMPEKPATI